MTRVRQLEAALSQSTGARLFQPLFLTLQAEAELDVGRPERAAALLGRALEEADATGERFYEPEIHRLLGVVALRRGRPEEGASHVERGREVAQELGLVAFGRRAASEVRPE